MLASSRLTLMALKEIHPDHGEDDAEGGENGLGRRDATEFLCKIRGLDGHIERGKDNVSTFLSSSVGIHVFKADVVRKRCSQRL
jgi:hypothetical protein